MTGFRIVRFSDVPTKLRTEIWNQSFSDYILPIKMTEEQLDLRLSELKLSFHKSAVCFDGEVGVGVILYGEDGSLAWIGGLAVIKSYRGKGVARLLMRHIFNLAKADGLTWLTLEVIATNNRALKFYQKEGFTTKQRLYFLTGNRPTFFDQEVKLKKESKYDIIEGIVVPWQNKRIRGYDTFKFLNSKKEEFGTVVFNIENKEIKIYQLDLIDWEMLASAVAAIFEYYEEAESFKCFNLALTTKQLSEFYKIKATKELTQYQLVKEIK